MPSKDLPACPICGGGTFVPGPNGRLPPEGLAPRCTGCSSLERHRTYALMIKALRPALEGARVLQFSADPSVRSAGFASVEVSVFGGPNHLDMSAVDRPDGAYDVVIANHVLEHVESDLAALAELDRICAPTGIVFLSVPDLLRVERTKEYGEARADRHGHWRVYGPDIRARWLAAVPMWRGLGVVGNDPVTGAPDRATVLSRSTPRLGAIGSALRGAGYAPFDAFA